MSDQAQRVALLRQRIERLEAEIQAALARSPNPQRQVTLVAASKSMPPETIRAAYAAGLRDFGENRVQEAVAKRPHLDDLPLRWHWIGHLQRNKVRFVANAYVLVHSLDRLPLALELDKWARRSGRQQDCLVQVNVSGEPNKSGVAPNELLPLLREVAALPGIRVLGLMTMAPVAPDPEMVRPVFRRLRELAAEVQAEQLPGVRMDYLSMGMSDDFRVAVEEGATHVRIGRALFGPRPL